MLERFFGKKQPTQSQTVNGVNATGSQVNVSQAGGNLTQNQSGQLATQQQGLSRAEVLALLDKLKGAIETVDLTPEQKEEMLDYLKSARREASKEQPDKDLVGKNLKQAGETMKSLKETTEAGKSLWETGAEVFKAIAPWIGVATAFFGL